MRSATLQRLPLILPLLAGLLARIDTANACAVCYGNPDSAMVQGAASGVLVLAGIIYTLLFGFVGVALFWTFRARKLRLSESDTRQPHLNKDGQ